MDVRGTRSYSGAAAAVARIKDTDLLLGDSLVPLWESTPKRFSMVMGDSVVKTQNIEPQAGLQHQGAALGVQAEADLPPFP